MLRTINACPFCGSGQIHRRREKIRYRCGNCKNCFPIAAKKEINRNLNKMKIPKPLTEKIHITN